MKSVTNRSEIENNHHLQFQFREEEEERATRQTAFSSPLRRGEGRRKEGEEGGRGEGEEGRRKEGRGRSEECDKHFSSP